jgi:hypothetical protein
MDSKEVKKIENSEGTRSRRDTQTCKREFEEAIVKLGGEQLGPYVNGKEPVHCRCPKMAS